MVLFKHKFPAAWCLVLCLSATAQAAPSGPTATTRIHAAGLQPDADLTTAIAAHIAPILPDGARLDGVTLGCNPPANATLQEVAPGVTRLTSRGFVVVLRQGDHTLACDAAVTAERQVLVTARNLDSGETVAAVDVQAQWVDAFSGAPNALDQLPGPGLVTAGAIRAGQPLFAWQLVRPIAIRPGDRVTVMITNGPVTLRALLEANSTATVGESATVINPDTGTPVGVTVTGTKTAELVMP